MERFSTALPAERVNGVLDPASFTPLSPSTARTTLVTGSGLLEGEPVWIAATDPRRARGALGVAEADALCLLFGTARREPRPLLLLIDSAGAKVDEGLDALGAFRRLFREALVTRLAGVPMLALLGKSCFGGASMLACVCAQRVYGEQTLLAVSGPGVIEALGGKDELDATDVRQVRALMGAQARARLGSSEQLALDRIDAFRDCAARLLRKQAWGASAWDWEEQHAKLGQQLIRAAPPPASELALCLKRLERLLAVGYAPSARGHVCMALPPAGSQRPALFGLLSGGMVGATALWELCDALFALHRSNPQSPVLLLLDAAGHAATRHDEASMLSSYLAHLSLTGGWLARCGHDVSLWIPGAAAGAVYVAFAAPAAHVSALRSARIRILPQAAVRQILGADAQSSADAQTLLRAGVIDAFLDQRLEGYAALASVS